MGEWDEAEGLDADLGAAPDAADREDTTETGRLAALLAEDIAKVTRAQG